MSESGGLGGSIFDGSPALAEIESPSQGEQKKEGEYIRRRNCEYCNQPREYICSWVEMFCVANGRLDVASRFGTPWGYDKARGKLFPQVQCNCPSHGLLYFPTTPGNAKRLVSEAIDNGLVPPDQMQAIQQLSAQFKAQAGQVR